MCIQYAVPGTEGPIADQRFTNSPRLYMLHDWLVALPCQPEPGLTEFPAMFCHPRQISVDDHLPGLEAVVMYCANCEFKVIGNFQIVDNARLHTKQTLNLANI